MSDSALERAMHGEHELRGRDVRNSREALEARLDPDFEEIGASGTLWTRESIIVELLSSSAPESEVAGMAARHVGDGIVLVTYATHASDRFVRRSSWWRQNDGRWQCFFHQGTVVVPPAGS
jgi:hypothetical protein